MKMNHKNQKVCRTFLTGHTCDDEGGLELPWAIWMNVSNTIISGNAVSGNGGGIYSAAQVTLGHVTAVVRVQATVQNKTAGTFVEVHIYKPVLAGTNQNSGNQRIHIAVEVVTIVTCAPAGFKKLI